jgi:hypothetical protein
MIRPRPATLFRALATLAVIGVLSIALLEVLVRVMLPQESPSLWLKPDERYGHLMKPNFQQRFHFSGTDFVMEVQTNSLGFRDEEPPPVRPGVLNVVFAGDSFTFGHGVRVEDRFDTLVEAAMRAAGKPLRSLNVGVNAWGTLQATRYIQGHLGMLSPDVIVLTFCENDPHDDSYFLEHGISFDRVRFPGKDFLRAHSHLFRLAQHLYLVWRKTSLPAPRGAGGDAEARAEEADKTAVQAARAGREGVPVTAFAPVISEAQWQRTEGYLKDFLAGFQAHNPAGRVILQATDPLNEDIREHLTAMAGRLPGLNYVDLAPAAEALPLAERRLPFDGHWSPAMHQHSAEALTAALLQLSR